MRDSIFSTFKAKLLHWPSEEVWAVVTDTKEELVIARIPSHIKHPKGVATALAKSLTNSDFALTDLV
jgi:hypothetical protein